LAELRDQLLDLLGCRCRPLRQLADFLGDDGKALAGLACPRRLDAGIERQQVGLEGDLVDHADDLADAVGFILDPGHGRDRLGDDLAGLVGALAGLADHAVGFRRTLGGAAHGRGDFVERCSSFLKRGGLLFGALRQIVGRFRNAVSAGVDHIGRLGDRGDDVAKGGHGAIEVVPELCVFGRNVVDLHRQVAAGQSLERTAELAMTSACDWLMFSCLADAVLALGVELLLLLGFAKPHLGTFAHRVTQDQNRGRHFADLVLALDFGHFAADILAGNRLHGRIQAADRVDHAANRCIGEQQDCQGAETEDDRGRGRILAEQRGKVIGIDAGADNPAPRRKAFHVGVFENRLFCARLGQ
jgi:hypothetical protein